MNPTKDTLDPINQFVTPDIFEGNGWPDSHLWETAEKGGFCCSSHANA